MVAIDFTKIAKMDKIEMRSFVLIRKQKNMLTKMVSNRTSSCTNNQDKDTRVCPLLQLVFFDNSQKGEQILVEKLMRGLFDVCEQENIYYSNHIRKIFEQLAAKGCITYEEIHRIWGEGK